MTLIRNAARASIFLQAPLHGTSIYIYIYAFRNACWQQLPWFQRPAWRLQFIYTCVHLCASTEQLLWHPQCVAPAMHGIIIAINTFHSACRRCKDSKESCQRAKRLGGSLHCNAEPYNSDISNCKPSSRAV